MNQHCELLFMLHAVLFEPSIWLLMLYTHYRQRMLSTNSGTAFASVDEKENVEEARQESYPNFISYGPF